MAIKKSYKKIDIDQKYFENTAKIYMLRCLADDEYFAQYIDENIDNDRLLQRQADFLELPDIFDDEFEKTMPTRSERKKYVRSKASSFFAAVQKEFDKLRKFDDTKSPAARNLQENLAFLKDALNLTKTDLAVLKFIVVKKEVRIFNNFLSSYDELNFREAAHILACMLQLPYEDMKLTLRKNSILDKAGIIDLHTHREDLRCMLDFDSDNFSGILMSKNEDKFSLISNFAAPCEKGTLTRENYSHIKEYDILENYLKNASAKGTSGVNVLFYGRAGTGKSELAKLVAKTAKAKLYKVRTSDEDGGAIDGVRRLNSYLLAQNFLDPKHNILLYDEVEDILNLSGEDERLKNKAFLNEMLETNKVPTIWITNNIFCVDNAIIRRFDLVINVDVPKKRVREQMLSEICGDKLDKKTFKLLSKQENLAPAVINRAYKVSENLDGDFSENFKTIVKNTLKAQWKNPFAKFSLKTKKGEKVKLPKSYSAEFINAEFDVQNLAQGIKANPNARICLYGLPGTGKSAYGAYIAKLLNRPYIVKKGSDLLDKYVGGTEQNIAAAFKEARKKKAVLVFDEVDSFLQDRTKAERSWELTQVNEMLTQMEKFDGVFIATTNLMDGLDKASLRRFDLKLEFKPLNAAQRVKLFEKECEFLGISCGLDSAKNSAGNSAVNLSLNSGLGSAKKSAVNSRSKSARAKNSAVNSICADTENSSFAGNSAVNSSSNSARAENSTADSACAGNLAENSASAVNSNPKSEKGEKNEKSIKFVWDEKLKKCVQRLENLTPGDFAAVKRQCKFSPIKDAKDFYERLCEEVRVKDTENQSSRMGFGI